MYAIDRQGLLYYKDLVSFSPRTPWVKGIDGTRLLMGIPGDDAIGNIYSEKIKSGLETIIDAPVASGRTFKLPNDWLVDISNSIKITSFTRADGFTRIAFLHRKINTEGYVGGYYLSLFKMSDEGPVILDELRLKDDPAGIEHEIRLGINEEGKIVAGLRADGEEAFTDLVFTVDAQGNAFTDDWYQTDWSAEMFRSEDITVESEEMSPRWDGLSRLIFSDNARKVFWTRYLPSVNGTKPRDVRLDYDSRRMISINSTGFTVTSFDEIGLGTTADAFEIIAGAGRAALGEEAAGLTNVQSVLVNLFSGRVALLNRPIRILMFIGLATPIHEAGHLIYSETSERPWLWFLTGNLKGAGDTEEAAEAVLQSLR